MGRCPRRGQFGMVMGLKSKKKSYEEEMDAYFGAFSRNARSSVVGVNELGICEPLFSAFYIEI